MTDIVIQEEVLELVVAVEDGPAVIFESTGDIDLVVIPEGMQGPPGASATGHRHTQSLAADSWVINHNLGFKPNVAVFSPGGMLIGAGVIHISDSQVLIQFTQPMTGSVTCS